MVNVQTRGEFCATIKGESGRRYHRRPDSDQTTRERGANSLADPGYITKTFEYRLRANRKFIAQCESTLDNARFVYNCALEHRINIYRETGKSLSFYEQSRQLTEARAALPEVKSCLRTIQSDALERLDLAFQAFFKRLAKGQTPGFPRFKARDRYHTFSQKYEAVRPCPLLGDKLTVPGVGTVRVRLSRPIEGQVKQLRITRRADGWYALLVCRINRPKPLPKTRKTVGVDVGLTSFATLSNGETIANPRHTRRAEEKLARESRRLSRKAAGSTNRKKARRKVALRHLKVSRARKDFHHKEARKLVNRFDRISVEDLNVKGMVKNRHLAKAISDVGWSQFFQITQSKAENAGRVFERRDPRYTSQTCSECGHKQRMPLAIRLFVCEACRFVCDRDHNAAINLDRAGHAQIKTPAELPVGATAKQEQMCLPFPKIRGTLVPRGNGPRV